CTRDEKGSGMQRSLRAERPIVMRKRLSAKCSGARSGYLIINSAIYDSSSVIPLSFLPPRPIVMLAAQPTSGLARLPARLAREPQPYQRSNRVALGPLD